MNFKNTLDKDIENVFLNSMEFADTVEFFLNDSKKKAPVILEHATYKDREKAKSDHAEGLFSYDLIMYVKLADLGRIPRKGQIIEITKEEYTIEKVILEIGLLTIYLREIME